MHVSPFFLTGACGIKNCVQASERGGSPCLLSSHQPNHLTSVTYTHSHSLTHRKAGQVCKGKNCAHYEKYFGTTSSSQNTRLTAVCGKNQVRSGWRERTGRLAIFSDSVFILFVLADSPPTPAGITSKASNGTVYAQGTLPVATSATGAGSPPDEWTRGELKGHIDVDPSVIRDATRFPNSGLHPRFFVGLLIFQPMLVCVYACVFVCQCVCVCMSFVSQSVCGEAGQCNCFH